MDVFDLAAKISLDTSAYDQSLDESEKKASSFGSGIKKGLGTAAKVGGAALVALGTTAIAGTKSLVEGTMAVAEYGDNIDKMSQKLGISAEAYQEWDFILQHSGASIDGLKAGMKTLSVQMTSASDVINDTANAEMLLEAQLENGEITLDEYNQQYDALYDGAYESLGALGQLGLTMQEINEVSNDQEKAFALIIEKLQEMPEGAERTALATELLGKSGTELGALLNTSAEDTEKMRQAVHDLGAVMSDDAVKNAAAFQDSLQDAQTAVTGLKDNLLGELLPSFTEVLNGFAGLVSGTDETGEQLSAGIEKAVNSISNLLPKLLSVAGNIVLSLAKGITKNLPLLVSSAKNVIFTLIDGIIQFLPSIITMLPDLISNAIDLVFGVVEGILTALPDIIDTLARSLPTIITTLITKLMEHLPILIDGIIQLVLGIVDAIPVIIEGLIDALPQIIESIISGLMNAIPQLVGGLIMLVLRLVEHLPEIIMSLIKAIPQIIKGIVNTMVDNFPQMIKAVVDLVLSIGKEVKDWASGLWDKISKWFTDLVDDIQQWGKDIWDKVSTWFNENIEKIKQFFTDIWNNIVTWFNDTKDKVTTFFSETWDKVKGFFSDTWNSVKEGLANVWNSIGEWGNNLKTKVSDWLSDIWQNITDKISSAWQFGRDLVNGLWNGIRDNADALWSKIKGWLDGIWNGIKNFFGIHSPSTKMAWIAQMDVEGLTEGLVKYGDKAVNAALGIAEDVEDALTVDSSGFLTADAGLNGFDDYQKQSNSRSPIVMNIYGAEGQNVETLADIIAERLQWMTNQEGAVYGY